MGRYLRQIMIQASGNPNIAQAHSDEHGVALPRHLVLGTVALLALMAAGCTAHEPQPLEQGSRVVDVLPAHQSESGIVTRKELGLAEDWVHQVASVRNEDPPWLDGWLRTALPFSFQYGGESSSSLLSEWQLNKGEVKVESNRTLQQLVWSDEATGLRLTWELTRFVNFPAAEWVLWLENTGARDTLILEDIQALDLRLNSPQNNQPYVVHGALGGRSKSDDLMPFSEALLPYGSGATRRIELGLAPRHLQGRSESSNNHLPFFNVETPDNRGLMVGVGWSGIWRAHLNVTDTECRVQAGLKETHFLLQPGEKVRTPRILLAFWEGKRLHGHNVFRRLLYEHYVPLLHGEPQKPLVSVNVCFTHNGFGTFLHQANEKEVRALADPFMRLGAELFIIDAGWFEGAPWHQWLGNWTFSRKKYPSGFSAISKTLAEAEVEFGLWFGPERANSSAPVVRQQPDLLRRIDRSTHYTVRMDLPEAREWFLSQVDRLVQEAGLTCFRQDLSGTFGEEPENRKGVSESHHIAGLYELWDTIKTRYPDMVMEGCCGGGRRIDLETISRFHWHQKSDRWFDSESDQSSLYGANLFLPGGIINIPTQATDDYGAWSAFAGQFCLGWHPLDADFPMEQARKQVERYKRIRPLLSGDFYPLTPPSVDQPWLGYQFHRSDLDEGVALIFRRGIVKPLIPVGESLSVSLRGLEPDSRYRLQFEGSGREQIKNGRVLAEAMEIIIRDAPGAEMITYQRAD